MKQITTTLVLSTLLFAVPCQAEEAPELTAESGESSPDSEAP